MYIDHNLLFWETTFRPSGGAGPSNFLHALEIGQGLIAHTPKGDEGPPKNFYRKNLKFGRKFSMLGSITSGLLRVSPRNFFQSTCRESGMINWVQLLEACPQKFRRAKKSSKILRDFWQLSTLIANISGTDPSIENRKSSWSTAIPSTLGQKIWCTLVHKRKSYWA